MEKEEKGNFMKTKENGIHRGRDERKMKYFWKVGKQREKEKRKDS